MGEDDPFRVLGVAPDASEEEIRAAHRERSRVTHPDAGGRVEDFRAVQAAYEALLAPPAAAPAPVVPVAPRTAPARRPLPPPERLGRGWWALLIGAGLVVLVLLIVVLTLASGSGPPSGQASGTTASSGSTPAAPEAPPTSLLGSGTLPAAIPASLVPLPRGTTVEEVIAARAPDEALPTYTVRFAGGDGDPATALADYADQLRSRGWQLSTGTDVAGTQALARFTLGARELQVAVGRDSRERLLWLVGYHATV